MKAERTVKNVVYVYGPFKKNWAEEPPFDFHWVKDNMFIYLQTDYETHWILGTFYRLFLIRFLTCVPTGKYLPVWALQVWWVVH